MPSKKYVSLLNELTVMENYILATPAKAEELGITATQLQQLQHYLALFKIDIEDYVNPNKKTPIVIRQTGDDFKEITSWIGHLRQGIKMSRQDTLTENDYESLFIHKNKTTRTRHLEIAEVPTLQVKSQKGGTVTIGAFIAGSEIHSKPKFPSVVRSLKLHWCFDHSKNPPEVENIVEHLEIFGTASPKIIIDSKDEAKYCHLVAYYVLPNGHKSQPSQVFTFVTSTI